MNFLLLTIYLLPDSPYMMISCHIADFLPETNQKLAPLFLLELPRPAMPPTMPWSCLIPGLLTTSCLLNPDNFPIGKNWELIGVVFSYDHLYDNSRFNLIWKKIHRWNLKMMRFFSNCITSSGDYLSRVILQAKDGHQKEKIIFSQTTGNTFLYKFPGMGISVSEFGNWLQITLRKGINAAIQSKHWCHWTDWFKRPLPQKGWWYLILISNLWYLWLGNISPLSTPNNQIFQWVCMAPTALFSTPIPDISQQLSACPSAPHDVIGWLWPWTWLKGLRISLRKKIILVTKVLTFHQHRKPR